ncbi:glycerate dehydrogenase [Vibrio sp. 10N.286.49.B3]|uniref:D-2-hydroxyacid dehydrogenase n=1 Tax=Vibrio sp. 10N.286.49.B3 TaxID=1880855 RepID=UPI000C846106|nr:D-2-hydroxyacid dehydrogenase [Vibrio sp. 10N.286.49.B3]PMH39873.1 glycerate dehydrogenase [Vibrio sp. 10N.286.49.B3]
MTAPNIVFLDRDTIPDSIVFPPLQADHNWQEYDFTQPHQVIERLQHADIVITNKVVLDAQVLQQLPRLRAIALTATGMNNVDLDYCQAHNIEVKNVQGYATKSVPEHVIGMIFALKRHLFAYHNDIAQGEWQRNKQFCFFTHSIGDVAGSTLGIVGSGSLGQATAVLAKAIGMKVIFSERKGAEQCRAGFVPFESMLQQADIVTLHCPLTANTENLIAQPELDLMPSHAILINTGRGGLVNEVDLVASLQAGTIGGAGVDVFTQEPADVSNPLLDNQALPNLLLTPHVAWGSHSAIQQLVETLMANVESMITPVSLPEA